MVHQRHATVVLTFQIVSFLFVYWTYFCLAPFFRYPSYGACYIKQFSQAAYNYFISRFVYLICEYVASWCFSIYTSIYSPLRLIFSNFLNIHVVLYSPFHYLIISLSINIKSIREIICPEFLNLFWFCNDLIRIFHFDWERALLLTFSRGFRQLID